MTKCKEKGSYGGDCCCNCFYQCEIEGHPWNDEPFKKTEAGQTLGYGCTAFYTMHRVLKIEGIQDEKKIGTVTLFQKQHGMCEMYEPRDKK